MTHDNTCEPTDTQKVTFHTEPLTVGELILINRIKQHNDDDSMEALVALLASRSRLPERYFLELRLTHLEPLTRRLGESLSIADTVTRLDMTWANDFTVPK